MVASLRSYITLRCIPDTYLDNLSYLSLGKRTCTFQRWSCRKHRWFLQKSLATWRGHFRLNKQKLRGRAYPAWLHPRREMKWTMLGTIAWSGKLMCAEKNYASVGIYSNLGTNTPPTYTKRSVTEKQLLRTLCGGLRWREGRRMKGRLVACLVSWKAGWLTSNLQTKQIWLVCATTVIVRQQIWRRDILMLMWDSRTRKGNLAPVGWARVEMNCSGSSLRCNEEREREGEVSGRINSCLSQTSCICCSELLSETLALPSFLRICWP